MRHLMSQLGRHSAAVNHWSLADSITLRADMSRRGRLSITC